MPDYMHLKILSLTLNSKVNAFFTIFRWVVETSHPSKSSLHKRFVALFDFSKLFSMWSFLFKRVSTTYCLSDSMYIRLKYLAQYSTLRDYGLQDVYNENTFAAAEENLYFKRELLRPLMIR